MVIAGKPSMHASNHGNIIISVDHFANGIEYSSASKKKKKKTHAMQRCREAYVIMSCSTAAAIKQQLTVCRKSVRFG